MTLQKPKRFLTKSAQAERYDVSTRTIDRWERDPALNYPAAIEINGRKLRAEDELESWERQRAAASRRVAA